MKIDNIKIDLKGHELISEPGKEAFYIKRGFKLIPYEFFGPGLRKIIRK